MSTAARKVAAIVAGTGVFSSGTILAILYIQTNKELPNTQSSCVCSGGGGGSSSSIDSPNRTKRFETIASHYDNRIQWDEFFMGMNLLRRFLLRHARGDVLEVGAGTGRNLLYYNLEKAAVKRVVLTDSSPNMLHQAQAKLRQMQDSVSLPNVHKRFVTLQADAADLNFPNDLFDTVIDTFGLCSYDKPVDVLKEMARVCKPDGNILLLEHGRSKSFEILSRYLDQTAEQHATKWGCVHNRDLDDILDQSGLEIQVLHKWHFGTTYYVVCRPPPSAKKSALRSNKVQWDRTD